MDIDATPTMTINAKLVYVMKNLHALNDNANKTVKEAAQEISVNTNLNFLINLAIVACDTKQNEDEPQMFNEACNHPMQNDKENGKRPFTRNLMK